LFHIALFPSYLLQTLQRFGLKRTSSQFCKNNIEMKVKKGNTFFQDRRKERLAPILLKVLKVNQIACGHEICKVRWHILSKDMSNTSEFPMATIRIGEFADFKPMPTKLYNECIEILKVSDNYKNARRRVLYRINKLCKKGDSPLFHILPKTTKT